MKLIPVGNYKQLTRPELFDLAELAFDFKEGVRQVELPGYSDVLDS